MFNTEFMFRFTYNESMKVESITSSVSSLALAFGEGSTEKAQMSRPFGVALLFAGVDKNGPRFVYNSSIDLIKWFSLYSLDPSGTYVRCDAKAIGSGAEGAQGSLGDIYHADISLKEATKHALTILKQVETFYKVEIDLPLENVKNLLITDFTWTYRKGIILTWSLSHFPARPMT